MIGIFDSGFGGLTIFKDIVRLCPHYDFIYLGDNARAPYGNHSQEIINQYTTQAVDYLFKQGCQLVILACNTASVDALRNIQMNDPGRKVLGIIWPLAEEAVELSKKNKIAILSTKATAKSGYYPAKIKELKPEADVFSQACPLLVPLIEESFEHEPEMKSILKRYLEPVLDFDPEVVILGCSHYELIRDIIQKNLPPYTKILDSGKIVAKKLQQYLQKHDGIVSMGSGRVQYLTTDEADKFKEKATKFFGQKIKAKQIKLS